MNPAASQSKGVRRWLRRLARDSWRYLTFPYSQCRGVYSDVEEALAAAPRHKHIGYDNDQLARQYREELSKLDISLSSNEYPILHHLDRIFGDRSSSMSLLDFGGNIGIHYLRYKAHLDISNVNWIVCDVPAIVRAGREACVDQDKISFIENVIEITEQSIDVLLASGAIQYVDDSIGKFVSSVRPRHILLDQLPLTVGDPFVTLQNGGLVYYPHRVFNRQDFISSIELAGYALVDAWTCDTYTCSIPFHPNKTHSYSGLYFVANELRSQAN